MRDGVSWSPFRFRDRWQTSLGELFTRRGEADASALLFALLEERDRDIEDHLNVTAPRGIVAHTSATATSYTTTSATASAITATSGTAPSITASLSTKRQYKLCFNGRFCSTVDGDTVGVRFVENGTNRKAALARCGTYAGGVTVEHSWVFTPATDAPVTYACYAERSNGAGTISAAASSGSPMDFWIEDVGSL